MAVSPKEAAEDGAVASTLAGDGNDPHGGRLVVDHADGDLVGDQGGESSPSTVRMNRSPDGTAGLRISFLTSVTRTWGSNRLPRSRIVSASCLAECVTGNSTSRMIVK